MSLHLFLITYFSYLLDIYISYKIIYLVGKRIPKGSSDIRQQISLLGPGSPGPAQQGRARKYDGITVSSNLTLDRNISDFLFLNILNFFF